MPKKSFYLLPTFIIIILFSVLLLTGCNKNLDQSVYEDTISISKEYMSLRYRTDNVLVNAKDYNDYKNWNKELSSIIKDWEKLEKEIIKLEKDAEKLSKEKVSINLIKNVYAYDKTEISNIFDKAPAGKKIMTLAKHLGVDVKKAHLILNQSQAEISSDIWKEEGDIYKKLEQDATRIKNGCKVAGFVGGVVLSGGTSAIAASGALAKTALVVSGADLVLEITDDEAKIALGDKNKVSEIVGTIRIVTEPAASILTIVNMPGNLSKSIDKLGAVSFTADQIKSVIQDDKILGISIKPDDKGELKIEASSFTAAELPKWKKDNNIATSTQTIEEILNIKKIKEEANENVEVPNKGNVVGVWSGEIRWTPGAEEPEQIKALTIEIKSDGTSKVIEGSWNFNLWNQTENIIKFFDKSENKGYYEFLLKNNTLTFIKTAGPDQGNPNEWIEVLAGEDFFGGKFLQITLTKK